MRAGLCRDGNFFRDLNVFGLRFSELVEEIRLASGIIGNGEAAVDNRGLIRYRLPPRLGRIA